MKETMLTRKDEGIGEGVFDSIAWALEVHVKETDTGAYNAAVLYGNEDAPEMIDFYTQAEPLVTDTPVRRWTAEA